MKRNFYAILLALFVVASSLTAQNKSLVFVGADYETEGVKDQQVIAAIEAQGGYDITYLNFFPLDEALDLPVLNAADVVIMGRSIGSSDVLADKDVWDQVTAPVLSMCLWGLRSSRALWFDTETCAHMEVGETDVLAGTILVDDPVFNGASGTMDWWVGPYDYLDVASAGNGTLLAVDPSGYPLFARWEAGTEFYAGSGQIPQGPRTFIGIGIDSVDPHVYFGFSDDAKAVFFAELARMADLSVGTKKISADQAELTVFATTSMVSVSMIDLNRVEVYSLDGKMMMSANANSNQIELNSTLNNGIYIVKAFDSNGSAAAEKFIVR